MTTQEHDMSSTELPVRPPRALRTRRVALHVVYGALALFTLVMAQGLTLTLAGRVPDGPYTFAAAATTAWKLLSLGGYLVIAWTGGRSVTAVQWLLAGQLCWIVADLLAPQEARQTAVVIIAHGAVNTLIFLTPWLLLAPERRGVLRLTPAIDRVALAVVVCGLPLFAFWAHHNSQLAIPDVDGNSGGELRFDVVGAAVVLPVVGLLAAVRPHGARWLLGGVATASAYLGLLALVTDPADLASPGRAGGVALTTSAALLAWRARADSASRARLDTDVPATS